MQRIRRIALLMERLVGFNHDVLRGIREFATPQRAWMCHFADPRAANLEMVANWNPHGLLVFLFDEAMRDRLAKIGTPYVDVANWLNDPNVPRVSVNDLEVGRLAAEHLLDLGLEEFAFVGRPQFGFSELRLKGFREVLHLSGYNCAEYVLETEHVPVLEPWTLGGVNAALADWVRSLPKPIGIFADNDEHALVVSEACFAAEIDIPGQVALLGVDNDPYLGSLGYPPLSSIAIPARRVGYEAASLLDRIMDKRPKAEGPVLLPPIGVVARRSTDMLAIADPYVAAAVRLIREKACYGLSVPDVVAAAPIGRRTLEKLFKVHLGRTPLEEIRRVRISQAQQLLATTDLPLEGVASRSGFGSASWLATTFSQEIGVTPGEYRSRVQG